MESAEIHNALAERFGPEVILGEVGGLRDGTVEVAPDSIAEVAAFSRDQAPLAMDSLQCLSAVDYVEPAEQARIEVLYHLYSFEHGHKIALRVKLPRDHATCPSVAAVWPAANWHEREAYDLMGVVFKGHPDLTRILLPHDWEGHPLRKDYQPPDEYRGIPNK